MAELDLDTLLVHGFAVYKWKLCNCNALALSSVCCDEIPLNACSMCVRVRIRRMSSRAYLW